MNQTQAVSAAAAGTITLGGDLTVNRLGYGAMRITGKGIWDFPPTSPRPGHSAPCGRIGRQLHRYR